MFVNMATVILLNHFGERLRPFGPVDGNCTLLPTMDTGYRILLKRATEPWAETLHRRVVFRHASLPIPGDNPLSRYTVASPNAEKGMDRRTVSSHTAHKANGVAAPPRHSQQSVVLALLILLLLVPGFLLFVEHVRKGDGNDERIRWLGRDWDPCGQNGKSVRAMIDVVDLDSLQPPAAIFDAVDRHVEVAKCQGWRDWIDYGSGWKGCVP